MRSVQVGALVIVVGIICLALGLGIGYGTYAGKTATTSIFQTSTIRETQATTAMRMNLTQTSTITETETTTTIERTNVTVTPYCCTNSNLSISTPCTTVLSTNYPPTQRLLYLVETDPDFIQAEGGFNFLANGGTSCGFVANNAGVRNYSVGFGFSYFTDGLYTDDCGNVENFTYYLDVTVPLTETGYNMSAIQISPTNSTEITADCSSTITSMTTQNSTIRISS